MMVRQLVLLETVFVSIIWYYTVYSFGVASIGLKIFSVVTGTTLEKIRPDVPTSYIIKKRNLLYALGDITILYYILLIIMFYPKPFSLFCNSIDRLCVSACSFLRYSSG